MINFLLLALTMMTIFLLFLPIFFITIIIFLPLIVHLLLVSNISYAGGHPTSSFLFTIDYCYYVFQGT